MKALKQIVSFIIIICFINCSSDDDSVKSNAENPIENAITTANLLNSEILGSLNAPIIQTGYTFSSSQNGDIINLGYLIIMPINARIQIWDETQQTLIFNELIDSSDSGIGNVSITPIPIISGKRYIITCANRFYQTYTNSTFTPIYPIEVGSITIHESRSETDFMVFPTLGNPNAAALAGVPTFTFKPN